MLRRRAHAALIGERPTHAAGRTFIGDVAMAKRPAVWRLEPATPWLREAPDHPVHERWSPRCVAVQSKPG